MPTYCKCLDVRTVRKGLKDIWDEILEFRKEPSRDEASDIMFGVGRLVAGIFGKVYVRVPGDRMHVRKIDGRMARYGCVRSERAVAEGDSCL